jgi:hypothetical protein
MLLKNVCGHDEIVAREFDRSVRGVGKLDAGGSFYARPKSTDYRTEQSSMPSEGTYRQQMEMGLP